MLCLYEFAKFDDLRGSLVFMLDKAYERDLCSIICYDKEVIGSVTDSKRHKGSTIEIAAKEIAKFGNILVFGMSLRSLMLFRCKIRIVACKMTLFGDRYVFDDV
jgi:hypothetical protein